MLRGLISSLLWTPTDQLIKLNVSECRRLEERLIELIKEYQGRESKVKGDNEILRKWYNLCNENYAIHRRMISDYLKGKSISERGLGEKEYRRQMGARQMPLFINFVNAFEYISVILPLNSNKLKTAIDKSVKQDVEFAELNLPRRGRVQRMRRGSIIGSIKERKKSIANQRKVLSEMGLISSNEKKILQGAWDIRNAMHRNFIAHKNIGFDFICDETGEALSYNVMRGGDIYTPEWGLEKLTERISTIMVKIILGLDDLEKTRINDLS